MWELPAGGLRVTGGDRVAFLQGQLTGNVNAAPTPGMLDALLLSPRSQLEFQARVYRRAEDLYLQTPGGTGPAVLGRLARYVVFDDVCLQPLDDVLRLLHVTTPPSVLGPLDADKLVQELDGPFGRVLVARVTRCATPGWDLTVLGDQLGAVSAALNAADFEPGDQAALLAWRVATGRADVTDDGFEGFLPQECGLGALVAADKGCYVGQETMARLEARGSVHRRLARIAGSGEPAQEREVSAGGRVVGRLGRAVLDANGGWQALAVVLEAAAAGPLNVVGSPVTLQWAE